MVEEPENVVKSEIVFRVLEQVVHMTAGAGNLILRAFKAKQWVDCRRMFSKLKSSCHSENLKILGM